jgi:hypothetical protein
LGFGKPPDFGLPHFGFGGFTTALKAFAAPTVVLHRNAAQKLISIPGEWLGISLESGQ